MVYLKELSLNLISDAHWALDDILLDMGFHPMTITLRVKRSDSREETPVEPLLLPYFDEKFPNSTLVHFYFRSIHNFAAAAIPISESMIARSKDYLCLNRQWRMVERESRRNLEWLARRKPISRYLPG